NVEPVAPDIAAPSFRHPNVGAGLPLAAAVKVTVAPAVTVWLAGCAVMTGAVPPTGAVKSTMSEGAGEPSRDIKRMAGPVSSCATRIHPKFAAGLFAQACTSATIPAEE